jgi:ATP adenylyltransferase
MQPARRRGEEKMTKKTPRPQSKAKSAAGGRPLWAPWRISFIRSPKGKNCFLCGHERASGTPEEPLIVRRYKNVFVILNRYPYNSGHLMIAPYRHSGELDSLTAEESREIMAASSEAVRVLKSVMRPDGFNAGFNLGVAAGAGVADHLHMHIVPRWAGDTNFMPVLGDTRVVPEALEETAALIRDAWKNTSAPGAVRRSRRQTGRYNK